MKNTENYKLQNLSRIPCPTHLLFGNAQGNIGEDAIACIVLYWVPLLRYVKSSRQQ
jgi:hypothetical protein